MADPFEVKARELLPLIYDIAQGKAVASTLVIAIAAALSQTVEAERERCFQIAIMEAGMSRKSQNCKGCVERELACEQIARAIRSSQTERADG